MLSRVIQKYINMTNQFSAPNQFAPAWTEAEEVDIDH